MSAVEYEIAFRFQDGEVMLVEDLRAGRGVFDDEVPAIVGRRVGDDEWIELGIEFRAEYDPLATSPAAEEDQPACAWCPSQATGRARHNDGLDHPSCGALSHGLDGTFTTSPATEGGDK